MNDNKLVEDDKKQASLQIEGDNALIMLDTLKSDNVEIVETTDNQQQEIVETTDSQQQDNDKKTGSHDKKLSRMNSNIENSVISENEQFKEECNKLSKKRRYIARLASITMS